MTDRARRLNEIPHETKVLKKEKEYRARKMQLSAAASIQKRIDELEKEFKEIYASYGDE